MSNFFDNFMGGLAFGMLANNPFFGGMFCWGFGRGFYNTVDFGTFANPFPSIFPPAEYMTTVSTSVMPTTFVNSGFPTIDFNSVGQSIWDMVKDPQAYYNKQMADWYESVNKNSNIKPDTEDTDDTDEVSNDNEKEKTTEISYDAKALKAKWSKKQPQLTDKFYSRVIEISKKVKCSPDDLMALMNLETRRTFSPSEKNPKSTATGLIQFTEGTAKTLGTSIPKLKKMTPVEQLDYVEKYLTYWKKEVGFSNDKQLSAGDLYALVAQPKNATKEVLIVAGTEAYEKNKKSWDRNNDKRITKSELGECLDDFRA